MKSPIIYIDNHLLVAHKPAGVATQPDFEGILKELTGSRFLHALHRLDRPVSGLVLLARSSKALSRLNAQMRERLIQKGYRARVEGSPPPAGTLVHYLIHGDHRALLAKQGAKNAKEARLTYTTEGEEVVITLETGRYHQIRAQFAAIGHPILGDAKYGAISSFSPGIALTCTTLALTHPVTKEPLSFQI